MQQPTIVEKPELKLIGLAAPFVSGLSPESNNFCVIGPLWEKFGPLAGQIPNRAGGDMIGAIFELPADRKLHPHELLYLAAVPVSSTDSLPEGMVWRTIPATTYAVFIHRGPITGIASTCGEIYREWLPQSGYEHSDIADIEVYDHRFCPDSEDSEVEYWISVRKK